MGAWLRYSLFTLSRWLPDTLILSYLATYALMVPLNVLGMSERNGNVSITEGSAESR